MNVFIEDSIENTLIAVFSLRLVQSTHALMLFTREIPMMMMMRASAGVFVIDQQKHFQRNDQKNFTIHFKRCIEIKRHI